MGILKIGIKTIMDAMVERNFKWSQIFRPPSGRWDWELWRSGKIIDRWTEKNIVVAQGCNYVLSAAFAGGTAISSWYILIFEDNYTPVDGNTYAVPGFTECTAYDEANRPAWQYGSVTSKTLSNTANKASFTFNATKTIYGGALVGGGTGPSTKGDVAGGGTLYNASQFQSGAKPVIDDDVLKVTLTLQTQDV